jgi:hypothetical protein
MLSLGLGAIALGSGGDELCPHITKGSFGGLVTSRAVGAGRVS